MRVIILASAPPNAKAHRRAVCASGAVEWLEFKFFESSEKSKNQVRHHFALFHFRRHSRILFSRRYKVTEEDPFPQDAKSIKFLFARSVSVSM